MRKLVLIGGVGNQLFILWRAMSIGLPDVDVLRLSERQLRLTKLIGWTVQRDWLGVDQIALSLKLKIRTTTNLEFAILIILFCMKKIGLNSIFDRGLSAKPFLNWDLGYFQSSDHVKLDRAPSLVRKIKERLIGMHEADSCRVIIHDRIGDLQESLRLNENRVSKALQGYAKTEVKIIASNKSERFKEYENISSDEVADFTSLMKADAVVMAGSTFCFWAVLSNMNEEVKVLISHDVHLGRLLKDLCVNVEYLP